MLHRLRNRMINETRSPLSGLIDADESTIGGPAKGQRGRGVTATTHKSVVIGAVEVMAYENKQGSRCERAGRLRLSTVGNAEAVNICDFLACNVERAQRCEQMAGLVIPTRPWWGTHIECEGFVPPSEPIGSLLMSTACSAILTPSSTVGIMGLNPGISSAMWTSLSFASTGARRRWPPTRPCWGSLPRQRHYPSEIWVC